MLNKLAKEKTMTTREVAEQLGVSVETVRINGKTLFPQKKVVNGKPIFWTENEVKMILEKIRYNQDGSKATSKAGLEVMRSDMTSKVALFKALETINFEDAIEQQSAIEAVAEINKRIISALQKKVSSLQVILDNSKEWVTVKRMNKLNPLCVFDYSPLRKFSIENGYEIKKVFDQNYGSVNAYHKEVWEAVYGEHIANAPWE